MKVYLNIQRAVLIAYYIAISKFTDFYVGACLLKTYLMALSGTQVTWQET
jgi:hypothetical protein